MKKIFVLLVAVFAFGIAANAQDALGLRFGGGTKYGAEISYQKSLADNRLEFDLGVNLPDFDFFYLTGVYQWTGEIGSGFGWFAGVGARLAMWSWDNGYNNGDTDFALALAGQAGLEYNFDAIPIQITLDIRPAFYLIPDTDFHWGDIALGLRYRF